MNFRITLRSLSVFLSTIQLSLYPSENENSFFKNNNNFSESLSPFIHSEARSLAAQKLLPSSYPEEAEILCSADQCVFGLTRGIVVGSDIFSMIYAPFRKTFDSKALGGSLYIIDAFGGFQVLRDVENKIYMNAQIGFRQLNYSYNSLNISNQGITTKINYSQLITPIYLQGLSFEAYFVGKSKTNNSQSLSFNSADHNTFSDTASYFYRISQKYPIYQVSLPAHLEVANWNSSQTGFVQPLRLYALLEPFYTQNQLLLNYDNLSLQKIEQNFGIKMAASMSYESSQQMVSGRFALLGSLGVDISTSSINTIQSGNSDANIPAKHWLSPYINFAGTWQF
jgi:hypothetical protein